MLHIIQSNRLERLFARLCQLLDSGQDDPLVPCEIVVQNPGMARWLSQQTALRQGIAANLHFPLPARCIWQIYDGQLDVREDEHSFDRPVLRWRILDELNRSLGQEPFRGIAGYLHDDRDGRKAYQLAGKLADLFDQYLVYRPDMLLEWERTPGSEWQALLWEKLADSAGTHRARYLQQFREKAAREILDPSTLPGRLYFFGISSLAPAYLEIIHAVSRVTDVYFFHLSPCREFWADIVSAKELALKRSGVEMRESEEYYEPGNSLLASLAKVGREFIGQLYDLEMTEEEAYESPAGESILAGLQRDILDLVDRSAPAAEKLTVPPGDRSVQFHSCHSRMREIQVLHDHLLDIFENDPGMKPGDIMVMAPTIEEYAPAVAAVFDGAEGNMFIPWSLADRSIRGEEPVAASFLAFFELCTGRCSGPEVVAFLENGAVMRRFGLDEEGLAMVRRWVSESGIRWGLDLVHRQEFGSCSDETHTWSFGMNRLFMGYLTGSDEGLVHNISPSGGLTAGRGVVLGRLAGFLGLLRKTRAQLAGSKKPSQWVALLLQMLDEFYDPGNEEGDLDAVRNLREAICSLDDDCRLARFSGQLDLPVINEWLEETLSQPSSSQAFLSGRITFCNMVPMRSVPFPVICLLGMNDTDYPRHQPNAGFDLIARDPRPGDRNRRDDDRYLFLEALLSARQVLYISWIGRDQRDNSLRPPSVVVADLHDYIGRSFVTSSGTPYDLPITEHPLQPFSKRCFDESGPIVSYAAQWLPGPEEGEKKVFAPCPLSDPPAEERTIDLNQLVRFWGHPIRFFLQQRLDMRVRDDEELLDDSEPFHPDHLERYLLADRVLDTILKGQSAEGLYAQLQAEGKLPHGNFGRNFLKEIREMAASFVTPLLPLLQDPRDPLEIDLPVGPFRLKGWLTGLFATGCIRYRPAKLKGRNLVQLWVQHLVYNALDQGGHDRRSFFFAADEAVGFVPVAEAGSVLEGIAELYWQGLSSPLHFYPETSRAWFNADALRRASTAGTVWHGDGFRRGEGDDPEYRIALQGVEPLDRDFEQLAAAVYGPLSDHLEKVDAAL